VPPIYSTSFSIDRSSYESGDTIILVGSVDLVEGSQFISLQILNPPQNDFVQIDMFSPNSDGSFSKSYIAEGPKWNLDGIYTMKLFYNNEWFETTFEFSTTEPKLESEPEFESAPESKPKIEVEPEPEPNFEISPEPESDIENEQRLFVKQEQKTHIPEFPSFYKSPQYYFDRYNNENNYKSWFDSQFPNTEIKKVVGYEKTHIQGFPDNSKSPNYYFHRYNNENNYKSWFDSQFPGKSIHQVLGFPDPVSVPLWIKNNAQWWASGHISDDDFVSGIQFLIENDIIIIPDMPESQISQEKDVPDWIRNNASWWSYDRISEEEFLNGIKYLIQEGIIVV